MTRLELTLALGAAMALSAALGWGLHALWARLPRRGDAGDATARLSRQLAETEAEAETRRAALAERLEQVETELTRALHEREAELAAAMDAIGLLRIEIEALKRDA